MPTSATGNEPASTLKADSPVRVTPGFTLLELMLVLLVIGLISGLVALRWPNPPLRDLRLDAERLAAQLDILRQQAWSQGQPLIWKANESGYGWSAAAQPAEANALASSASNQAHWLSPLTRAQTPHLLLPSEPVSGPLVVELRSIGQPALRILIEARGLSPFQVVVPTTP